MEESTYGVFIGWRIILNWNLKKWNERVITEFGWMGVGYSVGLYLRGKGLFICSKEEERLD